MAEDQDGMDLALALKRLGNNRGLLSSLVQRFAADAPPILAGVRQQLAGQNGGEAALGLHTFKGMAGTMGAMRLASAAAALEMRCKADNASNDWQQSLQELEELLALSIRRLRTEMNVPE